MAGCVTRTGHRQLEQLPIIHPVGERRPARPASGTATLRQQRQRCLVHRDERRPSTPRDLLYFGRVEARIRSGPRIGALLRRSAHRGAPAGNHPCVCGEQVRWRRYKRDGSGSSLRVRGTGHTSATVWIIDRVIPACAGNSGRRTARHTRRDRHPCVCGEQRSGHGPRNFQTGSSLRVRGTDRSSPHGGGESGVIPACAGNRAKGARRRSIAPGHPCVCGEQAL